MKLTKILSLFLLALVLVNCSKDGSDDPQDDPVMQSDDDPVATLSSAKELISFSIKKDDNSTLKIDADVQRSGTTMNIFLPFGTDLTDLVVSFEVSDKATLLIDGVAMVSGTSTVDLMSSTTAVVEAEDGTTKNYSLSATSNFDALDVAIQQLMADNNAPSMQLAITKGEKLVYQAQYGYADLNNTELVTEESVYRIASVSKPITEITIRKMAQNGLLDLDDIVFGANGILGTEYGTTPYATNIENITVQHLIDHTSGFTNDPYDPFFSNYSWTMSQLIDDVLDNRSLATVPGTTYYYSNFGYCLLGRIIEKISGMSYEAYVKQEVLTPLGISKMNIGNNTINEKLPNEVEYYAQENVGAYDFNLTRADALGGWTASATDLVRFMVGVDRQNGVPDLLNPSSISGSFFEYQEWVFWGSLMGTSSVVYRLGDDFNFAIVTNTRTVPITLNEQMQNTLKAQIQARSSWPEYDLFTIE